MVDKPTGEQLLAAWRGEESDYELVREETQPNRHGYDYRYFFRRSSDGTFWGTRGVSERGGDYITLRDDPDTVDINRVGPKTIQAAVYSATPA